MTIIMSVLVAGGGHANNYVGGHANNYVGFSCGWWS